jgi:plasmid stabilization system protein ParE
MIKLAYHTVAQQDMARLVDFLIETDIETALDTFAIIDDGVSLLLKHPKIGRPTDFKGLRELVISRGSTGYVALYEFDELRDIVIILRVKHQREDSFFD